MVNESSSNALTFQWSFPGGAPAASNQPEPTVYYSVPGVYSITLIAYNSSGLKHIHQNELHHSFHSSGTRL
jgi:PKD repeat protein